MTTDKDALIEALYLSVIAPSDDQATRALDLATKIAGSLTSDEVNQATSLVERLLDAGRNAC